MIAQAVRLRALPSGRPGGDADAEAIRDIVSFWRGSTHDWFAKNSNFDCRFHDRFLTIHEDAGARRHDNWMEAPVGALALLILTDQFPRNAFRGTPRMYATDPLARDYARAALDAGHPDAVAANEKLFFGLPFAHSEELADQEISVAFHRARLGEPWLSHAKGHRAIIRRFGRFPHRNAILGRVSTPEEEAFLTQGGFAG